MSSPILVVALVGKLYGWAASKTVNEVLLTETCVSTLCMLCVLVFSVDYNDELDILVSGSADFTVKVWALSAGTCLNTLTGHTEWVTKVGGLRRHHWVGGLVVSGGEWGMWLHICKWQVNCKIG